MLVAIAERYFSPHYFDHSLIGAQSDQQVLKDMVQEKLPDLYNHLDSIDIELSTITLNWFLAIFFDAVPFQVSSGVIKLIIMILSCLGKQYRPRSSGAV